MHTAIGKTDRCTALVDLPVACMAELPMSGHYCAFSINERAYMKNIWTCVIVLPFERLMCYLKRASCRMTLHSTAPLGSAKAIINSPSYSTQQLFCSQPCNKHLAVGVNCQGDKEATFVIHAHLQHCHIRTVCDDVSMQERHKGIRHNIVRVLRTLLFIWKVLLCFKVFCAFFACCACTKTIRSHCP